MKTAYRSLFSLPPDRPPSMPKLKSSMKKKCSHPSTGQRRHAPTNSSKCSADISRGRSSDSPYRSGPKPSRARPQYPQTRRHPESVAHFPCAHIRARKRVPFRRCCTSLHAVRPAAMTQNPTTLQLQQQRFTGVIWHPLGPSRLVQRNRDNRNARWKAKALVTRLVTSLQLDPTRTPQPVLPQS